MYIIHQVKVLDRETVTATDIIISRYSKAAKIVGSLIINNPEDSVWIEEIPLEGLGRLIRFFPGSKDFLTFDEHKPAAPLHRLSSAGR